MNKKIVLWYDQVGKNNCLYKNAVLDEPKIIEKLKRYNISHSLRETSERLDPVDLNLYFIELNNVHLDFDIFSVMSLGAKNLLKQGLTIVFYYSSEGHVLEEWFENLYKNLLANNLIDYNISFVFGDRDFKDGYNKFLADRNLPSFLNPISMNFFLSDYFERVDFINDDLDNDRKYDFLFYNGKLRAHRLLSVAELKHRSILDKGLVSLTDSVHTGRSSDVNKCIDILTAFDYCPDHIRDFAENFKPIILDMHGDAFSQDNINDTALSHYRQTFFSVVSESNVITRFQTEKTFKPIANMHPFILIAAPGMLALLKEQGFETFPELFDESYDIEQNHVKRVLMVLDEIEKFTKLPIQHKKDIFNSIKDKLTHNKNHYIRLASISGKKEHQRMFEEVEKANAS